MVPLQQNTPPDGDYFSSIDPSFGQNSDNDTDHVDNNKDNDLDNFNVNKNEGIFKMASVGFNEDDADANQDIFDADDDNLGIFDVDDIEGIEEIFLDDVDGGLFANDSSEADSNSSEADSDNYAYSKKEEVEQLVMMMKTTSEVCPVRPIYDTDGVLESQTYDGNLLNITHEEMERCVANGRQQFFDNAVARHAKGGSNGGQHLFDKDVAPHAKGGRQRWGKACNEMKTSVSIV